MSLALRLGKKEIMKALVHEESLQDSEVQEVSAGIDNGFDAVQKYKLDYLHTSLALLTELHDAKDG